MAAKKSIELYRLLLKESAKELKLFLKNTDTFEGQFEFNEINKVCYYKMYEDITDISQIKKTTDLYNEVEGLQDLYARARKYYLKPRNKSIKGLDVQFGNRTDQAVIDFLNSIGIKALRADTKNKKLPDIMTLDGTRNITAYIEVKYHNAPFMLSWRLFDREPYEGSITMDTEKIERQLIDIETELDRPVYYLHWVDFPDLKGIFFNTSGQIKEYLANKPIEFDRKEREGDQKENKSGMFAKVGYTKKFYPPLHEMGDLEELISSLKK